VTRSKHCVPQQEKPAWHAWVGEQPGTQVLVMQIEPIGQSTSMTQPTHWFVCVLQMMSFAGSQSVSSVHPTVH
jgi:hypothetical protein